MNNQIDIKLLNNGTLPIEPGYLYLKAQAKAMFLAGYQFKKIAESLSIPNPETIANWAGHDNWHEERDKILAQTTRLRLSELLSSQDSNIKDLKSIREKAIKAVDDGTVTPGRFSEAVNSYIGALDMERKLKMEALQVSFITDVAIIIRDEVEDKAVLVRISNRLNELFEKYQNKSLIKESSDG
jgi:uncharacterized protein YjcR